MLYKFTGIPFTSLTTAPISNYKQRMQHFTTYSNVTAELSQLLSETLCKRQTITQKVTGNLSLQHSTNWVITAVAPMPANTNYPARPLSTHSPSCRLSERSVIALVHWKGYEATLCLELFSEELDKKPGRNRIGVGSDWHQLATYIRWGFLPCYTDSLQAPCSRLLPH